MRFRKRKNGSTAPMSNVPGPLTEEAYARVEEVLIRVGLDPDNRFKHHAHKETSYWGPGYQLEWTERECGTRFLLTRGGVDGRVREIVVVNLEREVLSAEALAEVNAELAHILEEYNY